MRFNLSLLRFLSFSLFLTISGITARAQSDRGTIAGTVLDSSGGVVANVTVTANANCNINASMVTVTAAMVTVNAAMSQFSGVVQADTVITNCTTAGIQSALAGANGTISFNCGANPVVITVTEPAP